MSAVETKAFIRVSGANFITIQDNHPEKASGNEIPLLTPILAGFFVSYYVTGVSPFRLTPSGDEAFPSLEPRKSPFRPRR